MAFQHASTPVRARTEDILSADNTKPDRFTLMDALRRAASALALGPSVIATVDALLSCLPPKRDHDLVFASNATLVMRRNGISDRTLRRHLAELVEAGLLVRIDSPNGKRYAKRDPLMGSILRFGLDLSPLFSAFDRIHAIAQEQAITAQRISFLRTRLRVAIRSVIAAGRDSPLLAEAERALRRKLTAIELEHWLKQLDAVAGPWTVLAIEPSSDPVILSASNGQNVRHHQKSVKELPKKELIETEWPNLPTGPEDLSESVTLDGIAEACPQATGFLLEKLRSPWDVIAHARRLAPMIGIESTCYDAAEAKHGPFGTALTIWGMMEILDRVHKPGAYFRTITSGRRSSTFNPWTLIDGLIRKSQRKARDCPRTTSYCS